MQIKETFLKLTTRTYPHGTESDLFDLLPQDLEFDEFGNLFKQIGDAPSTMFTSHLDTATSALTVVNHVFEGNIIKTDGKSILGADDKAGVTVMLYLMEKNVPGLYYFFLAEEVGCQGSKKLAAKHKTEPIPYIKKVVSFDRRSTDSIITFQCSTRCCSENFATALGQALNEAGVKITDNNTALNYSNDPTGVYTDSAQFTAIYPECTNVSVGYKNEHTFSELQDIKFLDKLAKAAALVDWESLPVERDPSKTEYKSYGSTYWGGGAWGYDDDEYVYAKSTTKKPTNEEKTWFVDDRFGKFVSYVNHNTVTNKIIGVDLAEERIEYEADLIAQLLMQMDLDHKSFTWDGFSLHLEYNGMNSGPISSCDRNDLAEFIPELEFWEECVEEDEFPF